MLHPVVVDVPTFPVFCGPRAIACISGKPISKVYEMLTTRLGYRLPVEGISLGSASIALQNFGFVCTDQSSVGRNPQELEVFLRMYSFTGTFLVGVPDHVFAVSHHRICGQTSDQPETIGERHFTSELVLGWCKFERLTRASLVR